MIPRHADPFEPNTSAAHIIHVQTKDGVEIAVSTIKVESYADHGPSTRWETAVYGPDETEFMGCFKNTDLSYFKPTGAAIAEEVQAMTYAEMLEARDRRFMF